MYMIILLYNYWFCIVQVADDFTDISSPLKALSDAAVAPFGQIMFSLTCLIQLLLISSYVLSIFFTYKLFVF